MHRATIKLFLHCAALAALLCCCVPAAAQEAPALPPGLATPAEQPPLPDGIGESEAPSLPAGLSDSPAHDRSARPGTPAAQQLPFALTGFLDLRGGTRLRSDRYQKRESLGEVRLQAEASRSWDRIGFRLTGDFVYDPVLDRSRLRLNRGEGWLDLREAYIYGTPLGFMDVKAGRQIMTWGTGDLLFINDLFPKDWNSFFIGRDAEYLKAPSDALRMTLYLDAVNIDLYFVPEFDHDRFLDGRRLSYWNAAEGRRSGRDRIVRPHRHSDWFDDEETGGRIFKNISGYELALYWYAGFWKSPAGSDRQTGTPLFPDLRVLGASARGRLFRGIGSAEFGYYDSRRDRSGNDPFVRNSELRLLLGYEQEVARDFTVGLQYYLEHMRRHGSYRASLPPGVHPRDQNRHVLTLRLTKLLLSQNLTAGLFLYWSPSDSDAYARPNVQYKIRDDLAIEAGGNIFIGRHDHTFFGQLEKNTNIYFSLRRYFSL